MPNSSAPENYNGVWTLVPDECVDPQSASLQQAEDFNIDSWANYVNSLMVDLVPGIVLGAVAVVGFFTFLIWTCVRCRRRHRIRAARESKQQAKEDARQHLQFLSSGGPSVPAPAPASRKLTAGKVLRWAMVLFGLATIGVSGWGLAQSIIASNDVILNFWDLVNQVQQLAADIETELSGLGASMIQLSATLGGALGALRSLLNLVSSIPVLGTLIPVAKVEGWLGTDAQAALGTLNSTGQLIENQIVPVINDQVLPTIQQIQDNNYGWSMSIEDTWRFVVIAVLFGLLILMTALVTLACYSMRRGVVATVLVALLWLLIAIVLIFGLGLFNGARSVADDACLYSEELVYRRLNASLTGDTRDKVMGGVNYYLGRTPYLTNTSGLPLVVPLNGTTQCDAQLTAALLREILNVDVADAIVLVWGIAEDLPSLSGAISNVPLLPSTVTDPLANATALLQTTLAQACNLTLLLVRENRVWPLYVSVKAYICCTLTSAIYDVWVPWTVAGVLSLVFALLASARIITSTISPHTNSPGGGGAKTDAEVPPGAVQMAQLGFGSQPQAVQPPVAQTYSNSGAPTQPPLL